MTAWIINSEMSLQSALGDLRELFLRDKYVKVSAKVGKDRSIPQNSISHAWYAQVERELREDDALGVKCFCKLNFGVPILRAEDEEFRSFYDRAIKGLTYEQKIQAMTFVPVTSRMSKTQKSTYLETMQKHYSKRGVRLEFPEE